MNKTCPEGIPKLPGVYLFKDNSDTPIYIGKAKNLRTRVKSYFTGYKTDWKITSLINDYANLAHIITPSEHEALILEAQLIQKYQPKYNRLLKEGQPFVYILCTKTKLPTFIVVRNKKQKGIYFGPFMHKIQARKTTEFLRNTFNLHTCNKKIENGCLQYHIGKCAGTCKIHFDAHAYRTRVELALNVLRNERELFIQTIKKEIKTYNEKLEFEKAKNLHSYLKTVDTIFAALKYHMSHNVYSRNIATALTPHTYTPTPSENLDIQLQQLLEHSHPIRTIDCFDISHFQSKSIVGSCIRFKNGIPDKNKFRRFKIKTLTQQNDYAALQEIVMRRYKNIADIPDLILIDGGIGQLNAIKTLLPTAPLASLAKREERLYCPTFPNGLILDSHNPAAQILLAIRDYAHHFAITYHRIHRKTHI